MYDSAVHSSLTLPTSPYAHAIQARAQKKENKQKHRIASYLKYYVTSSDHHRILNKGCGFL